ncbi:hypothetical protein AB0F81_35190 [Actinoplanes sp. NPDC024001]|uniref:hypothetical protein n=1 Tax=Actinoplanes sp. NPDC024001 TaxID=3154598 RepID=UPI0033DF8376
MGNLPGPDELVVQLDERLRDKRRIDLGLAAARQSITDLQPAAGFQQAHQLLLQRATDLQGAITDLTATMSRIRDCERVVRFTELGWPERSTELAAECVADPLAGLADWLDDWFTGVAAVRLDACDRLTWMAPSLPAGTGHLVRRCAAATRAVRGRFWDVAAPLLWAGARGVTVGDRSVPEPETRQDLWILLIRFALATGNTEDAHRAFDEAGGAQPGPVLRALEQRLKFLRAGAEPPRSDLMRIGAGSPAAMLEMARVLNAAARSGQPDLSIDTCMSAARSAISAARSLEDAEQEINRMLEPIPAEIHLALAERALAEDRAGLAERSFQQAATTARNRAVSAEAHDRIAGLAQQAGDRDTERRHLLAAATAWSDVQHSGRTLASARRLLETEPDHIEARCFLGGALLQLAWSANDTDAQNYLDQALAATEGIPALVGAQQADLSNPRWLLAWAYFNESYVRARRARFDLDTETDQQWRAMLAALRAVALQPANGSMWVCLADAAYELSLWSMAELAARVAAGTEATRENQAEHIRALINVGEFQSALDVLSEPHSEFEWNMKAHLMLRLGQPQEAVGIFAEHAPESHAAWAKNSQISALLLAGRRAEAIAATKDMDAWLRTRLADRSNWSAATRVSLLLGDYERVEAFAEKLQGSGEHDGDIDLAVVRLAQGRPAEAEALLRSYIGSFTSLDSIASWDHIERPLLDTVIAERNLKMPDMAGVQQALEQVRARLESRRNPAVEFRSADVKDADPAVVAAAREIGDIVISIADDDVPAVERRLATMHDAPPNLVSASLHDWLTAKAPPAPAIQPDTPVLEEPAAEDAQPDLVLLLPPSWFPAAAGDPTTSHPLFLRHFPELRLGAPAEIPPVRVTTDAALEPAGYRVLRDGETLEQGDLPTGRRLLPAAARDLLPAETTADTEPVEEPQLRELGDCLIPEPEDPGSFAGLLSLAPLEVAARRLETVVTRGR